MTYHQRVKSYYRQNTGKSWTVGNIKMTSIQRRRAQKKVNKNRGW